MRHTEAMRIRDRDALRAYLRLVPGSDRALAARAGLSHSTLNHLLTGRRTTCSVETARAIEEALDCAPGRFFERSGAAVTLPPIMRSTRFLSF